jgi:6-pyruvoyl-tetrahydropterin synthase
LHGYSLAFTFKFGCTHIDTNNWVVDFGSLKKLKEWLKDKFDHTLIIDKKDPSKDFLTTLQSKDLAQIVVFDGVGVEKFAEHAFIYADALIRKETKDRCFVVKVTCSEHEANSATYEI